MEFRDTDVKDGGSKFFEGIFEGVITSSKMKVNNGDGNWNVVTEASPYNDSAVWEIGVRIGKAEKSNFISLYGGEPYEGKQHKWATLMKNCGLDPFKAFHDQVIGRTIKVLAYAEKPTADGNIWSRLWNATFSTEVTNEQIEGWFKSMLASATDKNRVKKTINPESKFLEMKETTTQVGSTAEPDYDVPARSPKIEDDPF
jgi:hypothetical protein